MEKPTERNALVQTILTPCPPLIAPSPPIGSDCGPEGFAARNKEEKYVWVWKRYPNGRSDYCCKGCQESFSGTAQKIRVHITGVKESDCRIAV